MHAHNPRVLASVFLALALVASGCEPQENADVARTDTADSHLADAVSPDTSVTALIPGPTGAVTCASADSLQLSDGASGTLALQPQTHGHELHVPAGAVPNGQTVTFTMRDMRATYVAVDLNVRGGPTTFDQPVKLRLSYAGCTAPDTANLGIYRRTGGNWVRVSGSSLDTATQSVSVDLTNLSQYALGAG